MPVVDLQLNPSQDLIAQAGVLRHELGHVLGLPPTAPAATSDGSVRFISDSVTTVVWAAANDRGTLFFHILPSSDDASAGGDVDGDGRADIIAGSGVGVYVTHPDLYLNVWINQSELDGVIDIIGRDVSGADDSSHGTHVAGTIGAIGNNGVGVADDGGIGNDVLLGGLGRGSAEQTSIYRHQGGSNIVYTDGHAK